MLALLLVVFTGCWYSVHTIHMYHADAAMMEKVYTEEYATPDSEEVLALTKKGQQRQGTKHKRPRTAGHILVRFDI